MRAGQEGHGGEGGREPPDAATVDGAFFTLRLCHMGPGMLTNSRIMSLIDVSICITCWGFCVLYGGTLSSLSAFYLIAKL